MNKIKERVLSILENIGILVFEDEENEVLEIDSLQYINIIVEIEDEFNIIVDDTYLVFEDITVQKLINMVEQQIALHN